MLTKEELMSVLASCEVPYAFLAFDSSQAPPYAVVLEDDTENISCDRETMEIKSGWQIELYYRNIDDRFAFEEWLLQNPVVWERQGTDSWIEGEELYMSRYTL